MLLGQLLKLTNIPENEGNPSMMEEVRLLQEAKDYIQVTVSETNKRAGEENLRGLLDDMQKHLRIGDFLLGFGLTMLAGLSSIMVVPGVEPSVLALLWGSRAVRTSRPV